MNKNKKNYGQSEHEIQTKFKMILNIWLQSKYFKLINNKHVHI